MSGSGGVLTADFSGLSVRLSGLDDALAATIASQWAPFLASPTTSPWLDVGIGELDRDIVSDRPMRKSVTCEPESRGAKFVSEEAELMIEAEGPARILVGRGPDLWRYWGFFNLLAAALAVRLPSRPGALMHAAGIVLEGRAFLLVGAEGSGKSTWARAASEGGARVISDDSVLIDGITGRLELLGSPVRSHESTRLGPGRWPIAAILHARWGSSARLDDMEQLVAEGVVTANLPFVSSRWGHDRRLEPLVQMLASAAPNRLLTFSPDPSFVALLRDSGL